MEEFKTSIFEKSKEKNKMRIFYNLAIFGVIGLIWFLYFIDFPIVGLKTSVGFTITVLGIKIYNDKYMGISAYGERKANLVIAEQHLEINEVKILYTELTDLVIYVDEYLGKPKEIFGIHHGGNNKIEFIHKGRVVSINYVIKNKQDYDRVYRLVTGIEKNPDFKKNFKKLD
ncbi:MAG: hypothetical protein KF775_10755 [Cyclobacteriaceae bacterium]|nr:hypothetical protein [Cytophagales bacterium]MBX2900124.1 hypothetical protein [Cyclobacteriaceae bacterium]